MLKPLVLSLLLAGSLTLVSNQAQAEDVNFGAISCSQFMENIGNADEAAVGNIFMWLDGYLSGVSGDTTMRPDAMGKVSGWGWGFGYFGGMLALGVCLGYVIWAQGQGISADRFVPVTMLVTAAIYGAASLVTFRLLRERAVPNPAALQHSGLRASLLQLRTTFAQARNYRDFMWLLACAVFYQGGVAVAIALAAIYAEQVIGFKPQETMVLIFVLNLAAAGGALAWGYFQDRVGHKLALGVTLVGWIATCVIAAITTTKGGFWYAAAIAGLCMGSSQSAGRSTWRRRHTVSPRYTTSTALAATSR